MTFDPNHLPDDPTQLKSIVVALLESDAARQKAFDEMVAEMSRLNLRIEQLLEMIFGKKSEKRPKPKEEPKEESATETPAADASEANASANRPKRLKFQLQSLWPVLRARKKRTAAAVG